VKRVVIVCPTTPLTRQWAEAANQMGLQLLPDAAELDPPAGFHGVSVTYARAAASAKRWKTQCGPGTLIIADEAHHLGEELSWGDGFDLAFKGAKRWLLLSGTPFRSDRTPIPGAEYDQSGYVVPDISYTYGEAVTDGVCRPIVFIPFDGTLQWVSGDTVVEGSFADALEGSEAARRYRTAISTELADGLPRIIAQAADRLRLLRNGPHPEAGGLIVAADSEHARSLFWNSASFLCASWSVWSTTSGSSLQSSRRIFAIRRACSLSAATIRPPASGWGPLRSRRRRSAAWAMIRGRPSASSVEIAVR
jgi:superfamily II DNA or RNA helicase